ncbi:MAG: nucleotidyltransferase family protein [Thermoanaerobaculia bacterium]|nr:nucleotidyltransferase family protein [Thermoanaerobaculia bacterium]
MTTDPPPAFVSGILLAAGRSRRFGTQAPKQLFEIDAEPLVRRAARAALGSRLAELVVVLGHEAETVGAALEGLAVRRVLNPDFAAGQSTSVRRGLAERDPRARAAVFVPCDQPWLTGAVIDALLDAYFESHGPIVVPSWRGRRGSPVLFDHALFPELDALSGTSGGGRSSSGTLARW